MRQKTVDQRPSAVSRASTRIETEIVATTTNMIAKAAGERAPIGSMIRAGATATKAAAPTSDEHVVAIVAQANTPAEAAVGSPPNVVTATGSPSPVRYVRRKAIENSADPRPTASLPSRWEATTQKTKLPADTMAVAASSHVDPRTTPSAPERGRAASRSREARIARAAPYPPRSEARPRAPAATGDTGPSTVTTASDTATTTAAAVAVAAPRRGSVMGEIERSSGSVTNVGAARDVDGGRPMMATATATTTSRPTAWATGRSATNRRVGRSRSLSITTTTTIAASASGATTWATAGAAACNANSAGAAARPIGPATNQPSALTASHRHSHGFNGAVPPPGPRTARRSPRSSSRRAGTPTGDGRTVRRASARRRRAPTLGPR